MSAQRPLVSVIVPTRGRPALVGRALRSAMAQTLRDIEIIAVVDGEDPRTARVLDAFDDPRLRVLTSSERRGQAGATNAGIRAARSPWCALLDDDDLWMPEKLALQLRAARASGGRRPVIGCRLLCRDESGDVVWPERGPAPGEAIGAYLFERTRWSYGEAFFQTSTIFAPTELLRAIPIRGVHGDWDWLLRASEAPGVHFAFVADQEPLCIWNNQRDRARASLAFDWRRSLDWARGVQRSLPPTAYASLLMRVFAADAKSAHRWDALLPLASEAYRNGTPRWRDLATFGVIWLVPAGLRRELSRRASRRHKR